MQGKTEHVMHPVFVLSRAFPMALLPIHRLTTQLAHGAPSFSISGVHTGDTKADKSCKDIRVSGFEKGSFSAKRLYEEGARRKAENQITPCKKLSRPQLFFVDYYTKNELENIIDY